MPPAVSPWLVVITPVAALAGVWLGQFLQSRRDDRNWKRQAEEQRRRDAEQREDQRQRDRDLWAREDRHRFTEYKRDLYARLLTSLRAFHRSVWDIVWEVENARRNGDERAASEILDVSSLKSAADSRTAAAIVYNETRLVGSPQVIGTIEQHLTQLDRGQAKVLIDGDTASARVALNNYDTEHLVEEMNDDLAGRDSSA